MSARNWAMCPRCRENRRRLANAAHVDAAVAYGVVSVEKFDALRARAEHLTTAINEADETFREDYAVGITDDERAVEVSYHGGCTVCDLSLSFTHTHPLDAEGDR